MSLWVRTTNPIDARTICLVNLSTAHSIEPRDGNNSMVWWPGEDQGIAIPYTLDEVEVMLRADATGSNRGVAERLGEKEIG